MGLGVSRWASNAMSAQLDIYNFALHHLAHGDEVKSLTERTKAAQACNRWYEQTRDEVLRDFNWAFAKRLGVLSQVAVAPNTEWGFSYRIPADCLRFRRVLSGARTDTLRTRIPSLLGGDDAGQLLFCDLDTVTAEWTTRVTDPTRFPVDFVAALAAKLAFYIAPTVTAGDQFKLGARAGQLYLVLLRTAQANAASEQKPDPPPDSPAIIARN